MPDPEPSDSSDALPVNRIALLTEFGLVETVGIPARSEVRTGLAGCVQSTEQSYVTRDIVPELARTERAEFDIPSLSRAPIYVCLYTAVRNDIVAGKTPAEIRSY